eukprot:CAMPEP_0176032990 /NCGR_PEP_ID=MMETSP0120_2-20121206/16290_1 /TAXON_ID=160619 /ORGANISM="Kryptoperidinium foliaceum, Strain CCMP 1326" /LENGTH=340 /DNA_ID=CAMNT_0017366313 /DNA_START=47 /DNA_END=1069 /DNA_ORIENTATION=-
MDLPGGIWTEDPLLAEFIEQPISAHLDANQIVVEKSLDEKPHLSSDYRQAVMARIAKLDRAEREAQMGVLQPSPDAIRAAADAFADDAGSEHRPPLADVTALAQRLLDLTGEGGLSFVSGRIALTKDSQRRLRGPIAEAIAEHPSVGLKLNCYAGKPGAKWRTAADCVDLCIARGQLVRDLLVEAGVGNTIAPVGLGHVDDKGARCQLVACSADEADRLNALAIASGERKRHTMSVTFVTRHMPLERSFSDSTTVLYRDLLSEELPEEVTVEFCRTPLGIAFSGSTPSVVTSVDPGGLADRLGVQVGWSFKAVDDVTVDTLAFPKLSRILEDSVARLPMF